MHITESVNTWEHIDSECDNRQTSDTEGTTRIDQYCYSNSNTLQNNNKFENECFYY